MHTEGDDTPNRGRILRAFLIAPLAAPAGYATGLGVMGLGRVVFGSASLPPIDIFLELLLAIASIGIPVAYAAAIVGAAPVYAVLRRLDAVSAPSLWVSGASIGGMVAVLLAPYLKSELFSIPFPIWLGALLGVLCAEVFRRLLMTGGSERDGGLAS
ncbi:MAG TPA: hypothetical protein VF785_02910 [Gemmatimonadaceae bacterium]